MGSRGDEPRHVHDSDGVEIQFFRVLNTGTQESKVKLGSPEQEQAATRARRRDREKGGIIMSVPSHIVLNLVTSTRNMEINERRENKELGMKASSFKALFVTGNLSNLQR